MRFTIAVLFCLLCACGSDTDRREGEFWSFGDPAPEEPEDRAAEGDEIDGGQEIDFDCEVDADCGEDEYCHRTPSCDPEQFCREGYPPISAAPPDTACGCDGTVISVAAGYPGPHAWRTGNLTSYDDLGAPCDVDARPPFRYEIELKLVDDAFGAVDAPILARLSASLATEDRVQPVPENGVLSWVASGDERVQFSVQFLVDQDADGECTPGVDADYWAHAEMRVVDLETFEVTGELRPQEWSPPCMSW